MSGGKTVVLGLEVGLDIVELLTYWTIATSDYWHTLLGYFCQTIFVRLLTRKTTSMQTDLFNIEHYQNGHPCEQQVQTT